MPIHDWTRVDAGLFHHFHQDLTIDIARSLNAGRLPPGFVALADQQTGGAIPDVLTLHRRPRNTARRERAGAVGTGIQLSTEVKSDTSKLQAGRRDIGNAN
jgi:hypothetical protein